MEKTENMFNKIILKIFIIYLEVMRNKMKDLKAKLTIEGTLEEINEIIRLIESKYFDKNVHYNIEKELTKREKDIVRLICESRTNIEIGNELNISPHTVKAHIRSICEKLNVKDRIQIIVKALKDEIIENS